AAVYAAARGGAHHHGHGRVPAIPALGGEIDDLIETAGDEVGELHLGHGAQTHEARADGRTDNRGFGNRRIHYALVAEFLQKSGGHFERAAVGSDVLSYEEDIGVALHFFPQSFANGFQVGGGHVTTSRRRHRARWPDRETGSAPPRPPLHPL